MTDTDDRPAQATPPTVPHGESEPGPKQTLRQRAEQIGRDTAAQAPEAFAALSPEDLQRTVHELRVHQIELQMQNEERLTLALDAAQLGRLHDVTATQAARAALEAERAQLEDVVAQRTAALQASEDMLRTIYDLLPVGISITDRSGWIVNCNQASERLLGLTREEHLRRHCGDKEWGIIRLDGTPLPADAYPSVRALVEQRPVRDVDMGIVKPDGVTWLSVSAMPTNHPDYGVVIAYVDLTAHRQSEAALRASERWLRLALDSARMGVWEFDIKTKALQWSPEIYRYLGVGSTAPTEATFLAQLVHPEDMAGLKAKMDRAIAERSHYKAEYRVGPENYRWILDQGAVICDERGDPVKVIGTTMDISERKQAEQQLQDLATRLQLAAEAGGIGVWDWELATDRVDLDERTCALLGIAQAERPLSYADWAERVHPEDLAQFGIEQVLHHEQRFKREFRVRWPDDTWHVIASSGRVIRDAGGTPQRLVGVNWDITKERRIEAALRTGKQQLDMALHAAVMGIWDWEIATGRVAWAGEHGALFGIAIADFGGTIEDVQARVHPDDREQGIAVFRRTVEEGTDFDNTYRIVWPDGSLHWMHSLGKLIRDDCGAPQRIVGTTQDVTERRAAERALRDSEARFEHLAHFDALTGLPNRLLLADRLHQAMAQARRRGQRLAVAYLDLDGFKAINDTHGHAVGDQLLVTVADHFKQALREGDTLARLGGDEFVAVLIDLEGSDASVPLLNRLLAAAAAPLPLGDLVVQVSASLGVTFYPQPQEVDADQLLRQADQAMYQAKLTGKNRYHVFKDQHTQGAHETLERIRRALVAREFVLYYQPKINLRSGAVFGVEALIRWQHPQRGRLLPQEFLPTIEDDPLATELGEWVIEAALTQMDIWQASGLDLPVSVNVGVRPLQQADFVARLRTLLTAHPAVKPSSLALEILEVSAIQDLAHVAQVVADCRELGVSCALDDFGIGYSALTYLKHLAVTALKIDRRFVGDMLNNPDDLAIVESILGLASAFRRQAIAEGVETLEQCERLVQLGCELAQGYGIAHPMPAEAVSGWLADWRPSPHWTDLLPDSKRNVSCDPSP